MSKIFLEVIINETSSPALQEAYALGLDVENDPRFVQEILNIKLSQAKKLLFIIKETTNLLSTHEKSL